MSSSRPATPPSAAPRSCGEIEVCEAVAREDYNVSEHAYNEALDEMIGVLDVALETVNGEVIEDYPTDARGASCLVLCLLGKSQQPVHAVWGYDEPAELAILITVYRPDPARWSADFRTRLPRS